MATTFDTLRTVKRLRGAGASEELAEAAAETMRESRDFDLSQLATKAEVKAEIASLRTELKAEIAELRAEMRHGFRDFERRMTTKLGSLIVGAAVAFGAFLRLFPGGHP